MTDKKFILCRFIGHKRTMSNGDRWRLFVEKGKNKPSCWVCEKWSYTVFFWTRNFAMKDQSARLTSN